MEKLQAALARAREKRDGSDVGVRGVRPELTARKRSRQSAQDQAIRDAWLAVPEFEPSAKRLLNARVFAAEATHGLKVKLVESEMQTTLLRRSQEAIRYQMCSCRYHGRCCYDGKRVRGRGKNAKTGLIHLHEACAL